jgi:hypothetical protein
MSYWTPPTFQVNKNLRTIMESLQRALVSAFDPLYEHLDEAESVWVSYTPTHSNITVGDGAEAGRYRLEGKTCHFRYHLTLGATSAIAANAAIGLPATVAGSAGVYQVAPAYYLETGVRNWSGVCRLDATGTLGYLIHTEAGGAGAVDATNPFTWGTGDTISVAGVYEVA